VNEAELAHCWGRGQLLLPRADRELGLRVTASMSGRGLDQATNKSRGVIAVELETYLRATALEMV